ASLRDPDEQVLSAEVDRAQRPFAKRHANIAELRQKLQEIMWEDVGVMRTGEGMQRGVIRVGEVADELLEVGVDASNLAFNLTWHDWLNLASLTEISDVIARAGLMRENSRGAHYREDFPEAGELGASYYTVARKNGDAVNVSREQVEFTIVKPGETVLPEGEPETLVGGT
ncbi:MAG: succinate dehydrogenase/fumarate reductase flavoprotein subunit, partial [Rhodobacteraceae bacterium]|nr:succinate dehydrogenase/fumarate reductase flavoprotein subunit [Paracoccaceae bacterium]